MDNEPRTIDSPAVEELRQVIQRLHALSGACMLNTEGDQDYIDTFLGHLSAKLDDAAVAVQVYALDEHPLGGARISDTGPTLAEYDAEAAANGATSYGVADADRADVRLEPVMAVGLCTCGGVGYMQHLSWCPAVNPTPPMSGPGPDGLPAILPPEVWPAFIAGANRAEMLATQANGADGSAVI